jgi:pimeloyl-ACP methyl ester carboxylesterase
VVAGGGILGGDELPTSSRAKKSRAGWDVPLWALERAASYTGIPNVGHMVMLDAPERLGAALAGLLGRA